MLKTTTHAVMPAEAGIQMSFRYSMLAFWTPAFAGVTGLFPRSVER